MALATVRSCDFEAPEPTPRTVAFEASYQRTPRETVLGRGAFGVAFAVRRRSELSPRKRFVAKEISLSHLSEKRRKEAFAESELLLSLSHENVVACVDSMLTGSYLYIIMECANNGDLAKHIRFQRDREGHFSEDSIMLMFIQLTRGLHYVHGKKILHRDVKPANIFVFGGCEDLVGATPKLGDFGLGKLFEGTTFQALSVVGSPSYFSPEICRSRPYGRRSDVWSLGVVLHELAALSVPFNARTVPAAALMICTAPPAPLPERYSENLSATVKWLLQKDPTNRPLTSAILEDPYVKSFHVPRSMSGAPASESIAASLAPAVGIGVARPATIPEADSRETSATGSAMPGHSAKSGGSCHSEGVLEGVLAVFRAHDRAGTGLLPFEVLVRLLVKLLPELQHFEACKIVSSVAHSGSAGCADYAALVAWIFK